MPTYSPTDLEAYVRQRAPEIARDIRQAAEKARNEADLVAEVDKLLEKFARNLDVRLQPERERTLINGRADAVYNRFVIEYEPPRSLHRSNSYNTNKHAIKQVEQYLGGLERLERHRKERLAGVALDGYYYIFVRHRDDRWFEDDPLPVDTHSTETFLHYLLSLATEKALTPEHLVRDFGENSNVARQVVPTLYEALRTTTNPKVHTLFRQWKRQFGEVSGYEAESKQLDVSELAKSYAIRGTSPSLEHLFFAIHTYYATFIKLLALQIAHFYLPLKPKAATSLAVAASYPTDQLHSYLSNMERGGLFAELGIKNFLEGDFFGWYLDIWDDALDPAIRRLIADLANYSLVTLDVDPEQTRDLLKHLYQNLMPRKLRHALGEYYPPDWLAERLLNQLVYDGDPRKRLLDPACGSGTFLILAIKRIRRYADEKNIRPVTVLEQILTNIVGFDLNPLAVISARTNYLLALGDLLEHTQGDVSIPVYLADSILAPAMEAGETGQLSFLDRKAGTKVGLPGYSFNTAVGQFTVPRSLVEAQYIDQLADLLEDCVRADLKTQQFQSRLLQTFPLDTTRDAPDVRVAVALFEQLQDLERQGINGIWARIIKNAFAPLFQGRFDYVAGNPPWVNWESLPKEYRQETAPLWAKYALFPHKGFDAILGKAKDDISILLTYVALDRYLKDKGRLGFLITQSVFKTAGAGQGFRRFDLNDGTVVAVEAVDDMADIKPFEGASNRTAVVAMRRGRRTRYPVKYNLWRKTVSGRGIPEDAPLGEVLKMTAVRQFEARPINDADLSSAWITGRPLALNALKRVLGPSDYRRREGINTGGANGVYWVQTVGRRPDGHVLTSNLTEGVRREVENVTAAVEPDLLYPLLRGRDVARWQATPQACVLVTHKQGRGLKAIPEHEMAISFPKTHAYLKRFEEPLRTRSGFRRYFRDSDPFYSMFNVGDYTFAPHKVVWRDHKLMLVPCDDEAGAHYLCAALNSSPAEFAAVSYAIEIQMDTHILQNVRIPRYDANNPVQRELAGLSRQAHAAKSAGDEPRACEIEGEIDLFAAQLWGLTDAELKEIQDSLAELE